MNKKVITMLTALVVGGTMLAGTAFATVTSTSGYDTYKAAVLKVPAITNATANVDATVTDNKTVLLTANSLAKFNRGNNTSSEVTDIKVGPKDLKAESYSQDGKRISKSPDSDVYTVFDEGSEKNFEKKDKADNNQLQQGFEGLVDAYVGDRSNDFVAAPNADGSTTVTVNLDESNITPLDNAIVSFAIKVAEGNGFREKNFEDKKDNITADLKSLVPQLTSNITVKSVDAKAKISKEKVFESQDATITISGNDAQGTEHTVVITANVSLSDVGTTTPVKVDLTGKQVKTVTHKGHDRNEDY